MIGLGVRRSVAFIMAGAAGLNVFTPATDIGRSLMLAVREEGRKTRASNERLVRHMVRVFVKVTREEGRQTRAAIGELGNQIGELGRQIEERDVRMDKRLDRMSAAVEAVSNDIRTMSSDNREFFRQMLAAQNRILEKAS